MAIIKSSEKTTISVFREYKLKADKITQIADKVNIEATNNNLTLISNKKVVMRGNKR